MKRKITHIEKLANQMYDPKPELVSLVRHGANQTPFKALKAEQPAQRGQHEGELEMKKAEIAKAQFAAAQFADETAVKAFMEAQGFTECEVLKTEAGFEVPGAPAESFQNTEYKAVQIAEGAVFFLGKLKEGADGLETSAEKTTAKGAFVHADMGCTEIVKKYDYYLSAVSHGKTMAEVLSDAQDGLPPGMWELNDAFYSALRNLVLAGDVAQVKALCGEFGDMITAIATMMQNATAEVQQKALSRPEPEAPAAEAEVKTEKTEDAPAEEQKAEGTEGGEPAAGDAAPADPAPANEPEAPAPAAQEEAAAAAEQPAEETAAEEAEKNAQPGANAGLQEVIAAAIAAALEPALKSIKNMGEIVQDVQKAQADTVARVDELSKARQTRKSADAEGVTPAATSTEPLSTDQKAAKRLQRNALGFMNPSAD